MHSQPFFLVVDVLQELWIGENVAGAAAIQQDPVFWESSSPLDCERGFTGCGAGKLIPTVQVCVQEHLRLITLAGSTRRALVGVVPHLVAFKALDVQNNVL